MTWAEWCETEYNVNSYGEKAYETIDGTNVYYMNEPGTYVEDVLAGDTIISGKEYYTYFDDSL
jgi:hypothetical protein